MALFLRFKQIRFATALSILAFCSKSPVLAQTSLSNEKLTQLAEPAVVRVLDGCVGTYRFYNPDWEGEQTFFTDEVYNISMGSGFFVHPNGYIATNAHVVDNTEDAHKSCKEELFQQFLRRLESRFGFEEGAYSNNEESRAFIEKFSTLDNYEAVNEVILPGGKRFDFEIKSFGTPIDEDAQVRGKDVAVIKIEVQQAPTLVLSDTSLPKAASSVLILGYPSEAEVDFLDDESSLQMSTIAGSVSAIKSTDDGVKVIQISASVSAGISGGPVMDSSGEVVGLISFGNQDEAGRGSIPNAVTTSTLNEFIGASDGIENQSSEVDSLYREGLNYFWAGDYSRARDSFTNVKALFEYHSEVDDLIDESNLALFDDSDNLDQSEGMFSLPPLLWALIGGGAALGVAGLGIVLGRSQFSRDSEVQADSSSQVYAPQEPTTAHTSPTTVFKRESQSTRNNGRANDMAGNISSASLELEYRGRIHRLSLSSDHHKLGRDASWADLEIPNGWGVMSGRHATLQREGDNYRIFDGDGEGNTSSNGLKDPNGELVDTSVGYLLEHGTRLTVGSLANEQVTITFFNPAAVQPKYTPTRLIQ
ncbi:MAG: trypsin-like peptidase domain-containing protein [Cyanobacteria bacterium P01_B01_bin.77]